MKAVISVTGCDAIGIIAKVSGKLFELNINIEDISQTIMQNYFTMIMMVDTSKATADFATILQAMNQLGQEIGMDIKMQNQSIFDAMHRV